MEKQQPIRPGTVLPKHLHGGTPEDARNIALGKIATGITGSVGRLAVFTARHTLGNSSFYETSGNIGLGTVVPAARLHIEGSGDDPALRAVGGTGFAGEFIGAPGAFDAAVLIDQPNSSGAGGLRVNTQATSDKIIQATGGYQNRFSVMYAGHTDIIADDGGTALTITSSRTGTTLATLHTTNIGAHNITRLDSVDDDAADGTLLALRRARDNGSGAADDVASGDMLGQLTWSGYSDSAYRERAAIVATVDAAVSGSTVPTRLDFRTGTTSADERMRIDSAGNVLIGSTATAGARLTLNQATAADLVRYQDGGTTVWSIKDGGTIDSTGCGEVQALRTVSAATTLAANDRILCVDTSAASGNVVVTLPNPPVAGQRYTIVDSGDNGGTNRVILSPGTGVAIDATAANTNKGVILNNGESVEVIAVSTSLWWTLLTPRVP